MTAAFDCPVGVFGFLSVALKAYWNARRNGSSYSAITHHGVPQCAVFVALGREAWRVSLRAAEEFQMSK
jgi:hypothetical protein